MSKLILLRNKKELELQKFNNPYVQAATSDNTRKAYRSDIRHYESWGGRLPASADLIIRYLQDYAPKLNPRTLARRLTAIKNWHQYQGFPDPSQHPAVVKTMRGILRVHGKPKDKALPLSPELLYQLIQKLEEQTGMAAVRDSALLQLGFFGAFRRSELVNIQMSHLTWKTEGLDILIPTSKTDPGHHGQYCAVPYGSEFLCPVKALKKWLTVSAIKEGPLFREIKKGGKLTEKALSPLSVNYLLKKHAVASGLSQALELSSHSLRRGFATSASQAGAGLPAIMRQGRWKQVNTVMEYIEASERFSENAAGKVVNSFSSLRAERSKP